MSAFFILGLVAGMVFVLVYIGMVAMLKEAPELGAALELLVSALGVFGGIRVCSYILSGKISTTYSGGAIALSEEDMTYFLVGGFALIWISLATVVRRFWPLSAKIRALPHKPPSNPKIGDDLD
jgi:hypothetical protein